MSDLRSIIRGEDAVTGPVIGSWVIVLARAGRQDSLARICTIKDDPYQGENAQRLSDARIVSAVGGT